MLKSSQQGGNTPSWPRKSKIVPSNEAKVLVR